MEKNSSDTLKKVAQKNKEKHATHRSKDIIGYKKNISISEKLGRWVNNNKQPFRKNETDLGWVRKDSSWFLEIEPDGDDDSGIFLTLKNMINGK